VYPVGQQREVTVLQTGQTPYAWSAETTNFVKPEKDKLVVYELLVRDFDAARNYQSIIERIEYFKNLKINAIQLLPVMEFEGNVVEQVASAIDTYIYVHVNLPRHQSSEDLKA
jgi:1,4-alpha-glucan branching enzyme